MRKAVFNRSVDLFQRDGLHLRLAGLQKIPSEVLRLHLIEHVGNGFQPGETQVEAVEHIGFGFFKLRRGDAVGIKILIDFGEELLGLGEIFRCGGKGNLPGVEGILHHKATGNPVSEAVLLP